MDKNIPAWKGKVREVVDLIRLEIGFHGSILLISKKWFEILGRQPSEEDIQKRSRRISQWISSKKSTSNRFPTLREEAVAFNRALVEMANLDERALDELNTLVLGKAEADLLFPEKPKADLFTEGLIDSGLTEEELSFFCMNRLAAQTLARLAKEIYQKNIDLNESLRR